MLSHLALALMWDVHAIDLKSTSVLFRSLPLDCHICIAFQSLTDVVQTVAVVRVFYLTMGFRSEFGVVFIVPDSV